MYPAYTYHSVLVCVSVSVSVSVQVLRFVIRIATYSRRKNTSTPVRRRIKGCHWVLKNIFGVIKNNTQWFWCQTISMHQRFLYFKPRVSYSIDKNNIN